MDRAHRFGFAIPAAVLAWCAVCSSATGAEPVLQSLPTVDTLVTRLELTSEQEAKLRPLFDQRKHELQETQVLLQHASTRQQKRDVLREAKKAGHEFNSQVESVLTPTQKHEWREIRNGVREKVKERAEDHRSSQ